MSVWQVRGTALDLTGNPIVGATVSCGLSVHNAVTATGQIVPQPESTTTDVNGLYTFSDLFANADLTPTGSSYLVTIASSVLLSFSIVVTNNGYAGGRTWYDIALDNLIVAIPPIPGKFVTGPVGPPGPGLQVQLNGGSLLPQEPHANFIPGTSIGIAAADNPGASRTDITLSLGPVAESQITGLTTDLATNATAISTETSRATTAEALLASLASPALTGTPTAPTKTALTNNTDIATTAYSDAAVGAETSRATAAEGLLAPKANPTFTGTFAAAAGSIPAAALAAIPESGITNLTTDLAAKAPLASPALTGNPTAPT